MNRVCEILGTEYPIIQGAMARLVNDPHAACTQNGFDFENSIHHLSQIGIIGIFTLGIAKNACSTAQTITCLTNNGFTTFWA